MRTRDEIEESKPHMDIGNVSTTRLVLEVLLDIRDLVKMGLPPEVRQQLLANNLREGGEK